MIGFLYLQTLPLDLTRWGGKKREKRGETK